VDSVSTRVVRFSAAGSQLGTFGGEGASGPARLVGPVDVAVDPRNGQVVVADKWSDRVVRYTATGAYVSSFGASGTGPGQFSDLEAVGVDAAGAVYVVDQVWNGDVSAARLMKFTESGTFVWAGSLVDPGDTDADPVGVAIDADGVVHVVDRSRQRVVMLRSSDGSRAGTWGRSTRFGWSPTGIARGVNGDLWVVDSQVAVAERYRVGSLEVVPPTVSLTEPARNVTVAIGTAITMRYSCSDPAGGSGLAHCVGTVRNGARVDTTTPGRRLVRVTATDQDGNTATVTRTITVAEPRPDGRVRAQGTRKWVGNNRYGFVSQFVMVRARPGRTAVCEVSIQNDAAVADRFVVRGFFPPTPGYTVSVVRSKRGTTTAITGDVRRGRYRTARLAPGATELLLVRFAIRRSPVPVSSQSATLQISSATAEIGVDNVTCAAVPSFGRDHRTRDARG
jgi:hypothetical protein